MGQPFLPVFKKLLWNGRDESQLPGDHQSCLAGHMESLTLSYMLLTPSSFPLFSGQVYANVKLINAKRHLILSVLDFHPR